jgi:hypothetical protein
MTEAKRAETLGFPSTHQLPYVCVDMPQEYLSAILPGACRRWESGHGSLPRPLREMDSHNIYERFGYRYTPEELAAERPRSAAAPAMPTLPTCCSTSATATTPRPTHSG